MAYPILARDYLSRAKSALEERGQQGLFYAAFELRCCIEARQAEYVEALSAYKDTKIRPWKLSQEGRRIRSQSNASTIALVSYSFPDGTTYDSFHTPVTDALIEFAERTLHSLMHCQTRFRDDDDPWWQRARDEMNNGYRMAWLSCQGDSMVPPLWDPKTKQLHPSRFEIREDNAHLLELLAGLKGQTVNVNVSYPDQPPSDWICDL